MLKLTERYPDRSEPSNADYPYGGPKDDPTSALKGTPWEAATMGEFVGMMSAIVAAAKITPTGNTETAVASDILDALCSMEYYEHTNYKANKSIVTGSDGNQYIALIDNGPRSTLVDPVGDTTGTWHQYPYSERKYPTGEMVRKWFNGLMEIESNPSGIDVGFYTPSQLMYKQFNFPERFLSQPIMSINLTRGNAKGGASVYAAERIGGSGFTFTYSSSFEVNQYTILFTYTAKGSWK